MADLPLQRYPDVHSDDKPHPFATVGVDYIGPFTVLNNNKVEKLYICLFTCLVCRAIHLEVAQSLSAESCIAAIRRFVARRGLPQYILSDNGTNFIGARKQLRKRKLDFDTKFVGSQLLNSGIEWRMNPPGGPHFGGVWERLVQVVKRALLLNLGSARLTSEVFATIVAETEAIVNARPLTHVSCDIKDQLPLTPNHFLLGRAFSNLPSATFSEAALATSASWRKARQHLDQIWSRLLKEYIPTLMHRRKWRTAGPPLEVNDVVWLLEDNTPRGIWPLGLVVQVFNGTDGVARSCKIKTALGTITRPAVKLAHVFPKKPRVS